MDKKTNKQYLFLALFVCIAMLPNILLLCIGQDSIVASILKKLVFGLLSFTFITLPLTVLRPKHYSWFVILLLPFILFETSIIGHFKAPSSEEIVASLFLTNYYELTELIEGNLLIFIVSVLLTLTLLYVSYLIKPSFTLSTRAKRKIFFLFMFVFLILNVRNFKIGYKLNTNVSEALKATRYNLSVQMHKVFPIDIFLKLNEAYNGIQQKKNYKKNISDFKFNTTKRDSITTQEVYIVVIGETARKHNFSKYGYRRKTSPNLDTISNLFAFNNVTSNANVTSLSIPFILTRATPQKINLKFSEPAILNAFKEAKFKTYWISNQSIGVGSVFGFYSSLADVYKNTSGGLGTANYDEKLFPVLQDILNDNSSQKKFIVIHTIGSHFRYNYRYPKNFNKYTPSLAKGLSIENTSTISKKQELINSYDNSILYTDYVLANFINQLKNKNIISSLYYISDHGENLFDDTNEKLLHGYNDPTKYEIEIPLFIWTSKKYELKFPSKINALKKNKSRKISSSNSFHTILDMANITYTNENLTKSFANKNFDTLQRRTFYKTDKTILKID